MKFTIEDKDFSASTENFDLAKRLLEIVTKEHFASISKTISDDIPNNKYLTITADDITIGGKSTTKYNGDTIWARNDCMEHVKKADKLFQKEHGAKLLELHVVQANNVAGEPIQDPQGLFVWVRCVFEVNGERKKSRWVFQNAISSVAACRSNCANDCGSNVRYNSAFRAGLFESAVLN